VDSPSTEVDDIENILGMNESDEWLPIEEMEVDKSVAEEWDSEVKDDSIETKEEEVPCGLMELELEGNRDYQAFIATFRPTHQVQMTDEMLSFPESSDEIRNGLFLGKELRLYEHIASPGCNYHVGYQGHRITAQEMRGCKTVQYLVPKGDSWQSEVDDLEFERDGRHFLSGLSDYMPSRDLGEPRFVPQRHVEESAGADDHEWVR
jgi:hypothetical protein